MYTYNLNAEKTGRGGSQVQVLPGLHSKTLLPSTQKGPMCSVAPEEKEEVGLKLTSLALGFSRWGHCP